MTTFLIVLGVFVLAVLLYVPALRRARRGTEPWACARCGRRFPAYAFPDPLPPCLGENRPHALVRASDRDGFALLASYYAENPEE